MNKYLFGIIALSLSTGALADNYLDGVGGYVGGKFGTTDKLLISGEGDSEVDNQGFVFGIDYRDTYYADVALTKYEVSNSEDWSSTELDVGYRYSLIKNIDVFGSLGHRKVDSDSSTAEASGFTVKAGAEAAIYHSVRVKAGAEYFDEDVELSNAAVASDSKANLYGKATFYPGDNFALSVGYRALYKETSLEVTYRF